MVLREALGTRVSLPSDLLVGDSDVDSPRRRAEWTVAMALWWQTRLQEGHTPESAGTLLALSLPPAVLGHLRWNHGTPSLVLQAVQTTR